MTSLTTLAPRIELVSVARRYGSCVAVEEASLTFEPGAIHAVVGENGAGKSTMLKMAAGVVTPSSGEVRIGGEPLGEGGAEVALRRGVGLVHQHFMLVGAFTALDNLVLGHEPTRSGGRLDLTKAAEDARAIMESTGLTVPLDALTSSLTVGERQRLEILRVLYRGARAILLDEPTAVLSPLEADELYATLRRLADDGATLVVVTHRLDEVVRHADVVSVMRRGRVVDATRGTDPRASVDALTAAIMGGDPPPEFSPTPVRDDAPVVLEVKGLRLERAEGGRGRAVLQGVDLAVRRGEIVGVAGVEGNGQRELVRALAGLEPRASGAVRVGDQDLTRLDVRDRRRWIGVVHEDRHEDGLLLACSVADNFVLGELERLSVSEPKTSSERAFVEERIAKSGVVPPDASLPAAALSGGNQQKIVVGRVLARSARAVVLAQPTRGVDVGAAAAIHRAIGEAAASGVAVLVLSADLTELRRLSHRLVVIREGRIVAELPREASEAEIGRAMLGVEAPIV